MEIGYKGRWADCKLQSLYILIPLYLFTFLPFYLFNNTAFAQDKKLFSLKEAVAYALANNVNCLNAEIDASIAKAKKNEVIGAGLPQISGSFDTKDFVQLPTSLLPAQVFGGAPGTFIPVKFGTQYNTTAGISASQGIFNTEFIGALHSTKVVMELSEKNFQRTRIETTVIVSKAYYTVLVNRQRLKLLYANLERIKKLSDDTKIMNENGVVEKIDVDRVTVAYNNLLSEKEKIERMVTLTENLLKFQMGLGQQTPIVLSDSLNMDDMPNAALSVTDKMNYASRIEYSMMTSQKQLNELDLKKNNMAYLPNFFLYGSASAQAMRSKFDIYDTKQKWYPFGIVGATITVPIFDGFQKHYRIQQSKLNLVKTMNTMNNLENAIDMEVASAKTSYQNALSSLAIQKENIKLAQGVYDVTKKKYDAGVGSNLEVMTAETSQKEAQTNFYNALYDYYIAKIDYEKATGVIK